MIPTRSSLSHTKQLPWLPQGWCQQGDCGSQSKPCWRTFHPDWRVLLTTQFPHIHISYNLPHLHTLGMAISVSVVVHRPLWLTEKLAGLATGHEVVTEEMVGYPQQHRPQPHFPSEPFSDIHSQDTDGHLESGHKAATYHCSALQSFSLAFPCLRVAWRFPATGPLHSLLLLPGTLSPLLSFQILLSHHREAAESFCSPPKVRCCVNKLCPISLSCEWTLVLSGFLCSPHLRNSQQLGSRYDGH